MVCLLGILSPKLHAQTEYHFTLEEAIQFALENNYDLLSSYKDIETADKQVRTIFRTPAVKSNLYVSFS